MNMLNHINLMGRVVADPERKETSNKVPVCLFRIAIPRTYNRELTDWINIVAWRQNADFVSKYFHKGDTIIVEGSLQSRNYEDKNGNKRSVVEVVASQFHFAERKKETTKTTHPTMGVSEFEELNPSENDDLPF